MSGGYYNLPERNNARYPSHSPLVLDSETSSTGTGYAPTMYNNNFNQNMVSGSANIVNSNPSFSLQSSSGNFIHYAPVTNFATTVSDASDVVKARIRTVLKEHHAPNAAYDAQPVSGCMDGTRVQILRDIENWILNPNAQRIFWLAGMAGTGKTSIAWTVCSCAHADISMMLGGSFFCSRSSGSAAQRDVFRVIPTLAQLLSRQSVEFSEALATELENDPDILHKQIGVQVQKLLYAPLKALENYIVPVLFVVDGLDECGGLATADEASVAESHRNVSEMVEALVVLSRSHVKLPIKFLITSRAEAHIRDTSISNAASSHVLHLQTVNKDHVTADIYLYISTRLSSSTRLRKLFPLEDTDVLAKLCNGLFIIAATALQYALGAGRDCSAMKFETLLRSSQDGLSDRAAAPLDRMYALILGNAARADETETGGLSEVLQLLAAVLSARMALSITALADLLGRPKEHIRAGFSRLHAVVHVPEDDDEPELRALHASFGEYLVGRAPGALRISSSLGDETLARGCLRIMSQRLYFNVSKSTSSYMPNASNRPGSITLSLEYACLQWVHHVRALAVPSALDHEVNLIFRPRLLFWLEVLSALFQAQRATRILFIGAAMVRLPELSRFLRDANTFVASSLKAIERSAPHIYLSALPFTATDSLVYKTFTPLCTGLISVKTFGIDRLHRRPVATLTVLQGYVTSVAHSPDGHFLASGSDDGAVRILDVRTSEETMPSLQSDNGAVWSVAFAPNGSSLAAGTTRGVVLICSLLAEKTNMRRLSGNSGLVDSVAYSSDGAFLASASADSTVRLWQVETGRQIAVLDSHEDGVRVVTFSPDSVTLASGSDDSTIRLWEATTGAPVGNPLRGHDLSVISICFSQDGSRLASGSSDCGIVLWDIQAKTAITTLRGHSGWIQSVQFSSDGRSLVSASNDKFVRIWNLSQNMSETSSAVLRGHKGWVLSSFFSPDSLYIVSAAKDSTIRFWDAGNGRPIVRPLPAHEKIVYSVAVSPGGDYIVSGSEDLSVHVWDARTGEPWLAPLHGHTAAVYAVSISPAGHLIASASRDGTVRLWDAQSGNAVGEPWCGHVSGVYAVAFSPDSLWLASGSFDATVQIWEAATGRSVGSSPLTCDGPVYTVSFSPDGQLLAAGDKTGRIHLWKADTGQPICKPLQINSYDINSIDFSPDGTRIVSGADDLMIRIWDIGTLQLILAFRSGSWVQSVMFSSSGQFICSGLDDSRVCLWDASTGALIVAFHGHTSSVRSVVLTPDDRSAVSCSYDGVIRVWDVNSARLPATRGSEDAVEALASSTLDGEWLVGPSKELLLWVPPEYRPYLWLPPCTLLIGQHRILVANENSGWNLGDTWTSCWRDEDVATFNHAS